MCVDGAKTSRNGGLDMDGIKIYNWSGRFYGLCVSYTLQAILERRKNKLNVGNIYLFHELAVWMIKWNIKSMLNNINYIK